MTEDERAIFRPLIQELNLNPHLTAYDAVKAAVRAVRKLKTERNRYRAEVQEVIRQADMRLL